jgi:membrane protein implicated in regulation of membrane protease activity
MKRTERHHLKDNELAKAAATARQVVEERRGQVTVIGESWAAAGVRIAGSLGIEF